eukprot:141864-Pleurochrysis_carterae.AAC.1
MRAHDGVATVRAGEQTFLPGHHRPLGVFGPGEQGSGDGLDGRCAMRDSRPASERHRSSIGSTRPAGPESLEASGLLATFAVRPYASRISEPIGSGRRAPTASAPSPTLPGEGRQTSPRRGRTTGLGSGYDQG